jgi:hypothetical protein
MNEEKYSYTEIILSSWQAEKGREEGKNARRDDKKERKIYPFLK